MPRARLDSLLDQCGTASITLLSGPAGAGKSVVLSAWASRNPRRSAWITLDSDDNEAARFWAAITRATDILSACADSAEPAATVDQFIVLDNADTLASPEGQRCLAQLVESLPPQIHLLVAGRSKPDLPLHRLRLAGTAVEIPPRDLRFTVTEAAELFRGAERADLDPGPLVDRTHGWAIGLVYEATARGSAGDVTDSIREFLKREVLDPQPEATQRFLTETACFEYLSASLCRHVTGRADAAELLRRLEQDNVFIAAVDHEHGRYVYQPQFRSMLHDDLRAADPARAVAIHREAARWYEERDDISEAMEQLLLAGDEEAALLLLRKANARYGDTHPQLLGEWVARIDVSSARGETHLLLDLATACSLTRDDDRLRDILDYIDARLKADPDSDSAMRSRVLRSRVHLGAGDIEGFVSSLEVAEAIIMTAPRLRDDEPPDHAFGQRLYPWLALGYTWLDRPSDARTTLRDRPYAYSEAHIDQLLAWGVEANASLAEGHLDDAMAFGVRSSRAAEQLNVSGALVWPAWHVVAAIMHERDQLPEARATLEELAYLSESPFGNTFSVAAQIELAGVIRSEGDPSEALERLSRIRRDHTFEPGATVRTWLDRATIMTLLRLGRVRSAREALGSYPYPPPYALMAALVELADAEPRWRASQAESVVLDNPRRQLTVALIQARAALLRGDEEAVRLSAATALDLAREHGFIRTVLDVGTELLPVFGAVASGAAEFEFVAQLRRAVGRAPSLVAPSTAATGPVELSLRELDVLRYLPTQLSIREIAGVLYVSPNTVKSHIRHVYRKLGVDSRRTAVERARTLQLIL